MENRQETLMFVPLWRRCENLAIKLMLESLWLAMATPSAAAQIQLWDDSWHDLISRFEWQPLVILASVAAVIGGVWVTVPIQLLVAGWLWNRKNWRGLRMWSLSVLTTHVLVRIGKHAYARPRPSDRLLDIDSPSFPSAHSAEAAVMALMLAMIFVPAGPPASLVVSGNVLRCGYGVDPHLSTGSLGQRCRRPPAVGYQLCSVGNRVGRRHPSRFINRRAG